MRKSVQARINEVDYTIKELSLKQMLPLMGLMKDDPTAGQLRMLALAVYVDGDMLGLEAAEELGISSFLELLPLIMKLNGLEQKDEPGNV